MKEESNMMKTVGGVFVGLTVLVLLWLAMASMAWGQEIVNEYQNEAYWVDGQSMFDDSNCPNSSINSWGDVCFVEGANGPNQLGRYDYDEDCNCWMPKWLNGVDSFTHPEQLVNITVDGVELGTIFIGTFYGILNGAPNPWNNEYCLHLNCTTDGGAPIQ